MTCQLFWLMGKQIGVRRVPKSFDWGSIFEEALSRKSSRTSQVVGFSTCEIRVTQRFLHLHVLSGEHIACHTSQVTEGHCQHVCKPSVAGRTEVRSHLQDLVFIKACGAVGSASQQVRVGHDRDDPVGLSVTTKAPRQAVRRLSIRTHVGNESCEKQVVVQFSHSSFTNA